MFTTEKPSSPFSLLKTWWVTAWASSFLPARSVNTGSFPVRSNSCFEFGKAASLEAAFFMSVNYGFR